MGSVGSFQRARATHYARYSRQQWVLHLLPKNVGATERSSNAKHET
ncbi:hypothetical protein F441_19480 [Phytophthora nicotianae CJ01A1]|uniref:Uncharacterized protein n=4 Tax=Phytophthora nicotianae TaxID=4792 RepID=V9E3J4_PHYNI|nr:hypothetical protein F443_19651 [Phytophthora nicotianae P1569]ETL80742.1 hypothetical protein L917_18794 [Phytophthora nicotianae]ETM33934.1 hypothetical protein L914_18884 [Phytophthora nicotianae]ETO62482.1 hypothetical protein F444_19611 [Phytophthora nicotianae P1976]ETP03567.1 hypothetical protein F441_19480 [Phytophthora nicotianae CJ01A1]